MLDARGSTVVDAVVDVAKGSKAVDVGSGAAGPPKYETGSVYPYVAPSYTCDTEHVACASAPIAQL